MKQRREEIEAMINSGKRLVIISGEGEIGTVEGYSGKMSARTIMRRLNKERCGGDRWAMVDFAPDEN